VVSYDLDSDSVIDRVGAGMVQVLVAEPRSYVRDGVRLGPFIGGSRFGWEPS